MWKDSIRNIVIIFQTTILRIVGFYIRRSANDIAPAPTVCATPISVMGSVMGQGF